VNQTVCTSLPSIIFERNTTPKKAIKWKWDIILTAALTPTKTLPLNVYGAGSSPQIDDQVDQGGPKVVVAHNVTRFELEYRSDLEEDEWVSQWRSNNSGRNQHRNKFPNFVKIRLAIEDTENKKSPKVEQTVIVQVAFPNNEPHIQSPNNNTNPRGRR
jgi:hypothetical protein